MTTYFAWAGAEESFDPDLHAREDLEILKLTIEQQEGEVALATVVVAEAKLPSWRRRHVFISYEGVLLFSGRLVGLPAKIKDGLISLEFTAEPLTALERLQELAPSLKRPPFWDAAFVEPFEVDNPAEWLEARSALFAWNRVDGGVCVSDLFQGRQTIDLTDVFFADSLSVTLGETPLSHLQVNLIAEWIQEAEGEVNLEPSIAAAFPGGLINTLTPQALQAAWPQEGQKIGRSGFWVVESRLKAITPPATGLLNLYPTLTPAILTWDEETQAPRARRLKRVWMKGRLVLGWRYRQKRREIVHFTLSQKTQLDGAIRPRSRALTWRLQRVELPPAAGTFFLTHRGRQAVEHALERARAHLAATARCLEVEVALSFEVGLALSLDHSVRLQDPRIPGGQVEGKVVAYRLCQEGARAWAWVRVAASVGGEPEPAPSAAPWFYAEPSYGDTAVPRHYQTASGLVYGAYADQRPTEGIGELETLSLSDLVRAVTVRYDAEAQIQGLQRQQYPLCQSLGRVLEEMSTVISLDLISLKTQAVLEHRIHVKGVGAWTAPRQVNLSGA